MDSDPDLDARLRIPASAWWIGLASIVLAVVVLIATPGPATQGCFHRKSCFPVPMPPLLYAGLVLMLGAFLSTLVGRVPRHWVVGWTVSLSALATLVMMSTAVVAVVMNLASLRALPFHVAVAVTVATALLFVVLSVVLLIPALLASVWVPAPRSTAVPQASGPDPRPPWQREVQAIRAALGGSRHGRLTSSESLLVAELAYALQAGTLLAPTHVAAIGGQLLDALVLEQRRRDVRAAVLGMLERATSHGEGRMTPYRA